MFAIARLMAKGGGPAWVLLALLLCPAGVLWLAGRRWLKACLFAVVMYPIYVVVLCFYWIKYVA